MATFSVQWHITDVCNLRCKHCYQDSYSIKHDLDTPVIKMMIDKLAKGLDNRMISINLTGGEPLLRKDIFDVLDILDQTDNINEVYMITNGLLIDQKNARQLDRVQKLRGIKLSLEGSNAAINDSIRGEGTFDKIGETIRLLGSTSKPLILMFTLADYNCHDITGMFEYARKIGVQAVILERFVPEGQSRSMLKHVLSREEWLKVIQNIICYYDVGLSPHDFLAYRAFWIDLKESVEIRGALCDHGENSMALMPNGDIYPCRRTPVKIGNIIHDDVQSLLERLGTMRSEYRSRLRGSCRDCGIDECIGCRALARSVCNDIYAEDPQCYFGLLS